MPSTCLPIAPSKLLLGCYPVWIPWNLQQIPTGYLIWKVKVKSESEVAQSCPTLCDPMDCNLHVRKSMGFSRQEYWSGLPLPSPGIFPTQGSNSGLLHCRQTLYHLTHQGSHFTYSILCFHVILCIHHNPSFHPHPSRVHKSVLYVCVSMTTLQIGWSFLHFIEKY